MSGTTITQSPPRLRRTIDRRGSLRTLTRVARFALFRAASLLLISAVSVFLTILIAGKSVVIEDDLVRPGENPSPISGWFSGISNPVVRYMPDADQRISATSYLGRSLRLLGYGLTLNLGPSTYQYSTSGRSLNSVREIILDALPRTLLLFGTANLLIFFGSVFMALVITRSYGGWLDRLMVGISPFSAIPAWIYGVAFSVFAVRVLHIYLGGQLDAWPDRFSWSYLLFMLKHLFPPVLALFLSKVFQSVYAWRSFFLIFSGEAYLEVAKAKGLPRALLERRYLLRPALPNLITSFVMLLITIWQEAIVIELFFSVAGIGHVFYNAIRYKDMPVIVGLAVTFAYLLALTVFLLDIIYALVDPRVKVGGDAHQGDTVSLKPRKKRFAWLSLRPWRRPKPAFDRPRRTLHVHEPRPAVRVDWSAWKRRAAEAIRAAVGLRRYPAVLFGSAIILGLFAVSIYAMTAIPYQQAIQYWNHSSDVWRRNPQKAPPVWVNLFRSQDLPASTFLDSRTDPGLKTRQPAGADMTEVNFTFPIDYPYGEFPQSIAVRLFPTFQEKIVYASFTWHTPDGREIPIGDFTVKHDLNYILKDDEKLVRRLGGVAPEIGLFQDPQAERPQALPGRYELRLNGLVFEEQADLDAEFQLYGQVHGWAGTDSRRRDLGVALLWGAPIALALGFLGAISTSLATMLIAAVGTWYGGWLDALVQRLTEINMILPVFPILLIVYSFYSSSFWAVLGVAILLSIFGSSIKTYRAVFLQLKEAPYMEAARAYGASSPRLIFHYLVPRIFPVLVPQMVILIPTYVYFEATLAYLNMSDPLLPTWGKVIQDAIANGALTGAYHWILEPVAILVLTGFAFLLLGFALDRVLNPTLRDI